MSAARDLPVEVDEASGCWIWQGYVLPSGYGQLGRNTLAHRHVYELLIGPIPAGMDLDHDCHNADETCPGGPSCRHRRCVNPAHVAPSTRGENVLRGRSRPAENARKTHCIHGHEFTPENTRKRRGGRECRRCHRDRMRAARGDA